jgi:hypothetical protein
MINAETAAIKYLNSHGKLGAVAKSVLVIQSCETRGQMSMAVEYAKLVMLRESVGVVDYRKIERAVENTVARLW